MMIYNVEETKIGNYFKINYILARQLMIIYDIYKYRLLDATIEDINNSMIEKVFHFENKVSYGYYNIPKGWAYYLSQGNSHKDIKSFINWFFKHKQQPINYLIEGVIKGKQEKRNPIKEDFIADSTEYGGTPIQIEDKHGNITKKAFKRF